MAELLYTNLSLSYGVCHCCTGKGLHKNISKEYHYNGIREVYKDIIKDTFNISTKSAAYMLICSSCILQLRDANNFKKKIIRSQRQLLDCYEDSTNVGNDVKHEVLTNEYDDSMQIDFEEFGNNDDLIDNEHYDSDEKDAFDRGALHNNDAHLKKRELLERLAEIPFRPLPKRSVLPKAPPISFMQKLNSLKGKTITSTHIRDMLTLNNYAKKVNVQMSEKNAHVHNASTILKYSNAIPFKSKNFNGYPCFYCRLAYKMPVELREHVASAHSSVSVRNSLWKYGAECLIVYIDVTNLICTLCSASMKNLTEFKEHLRNVHKKNLCLDYTDRVIPFKLSHENIYECQVCGFNFETFGAIERHMNTHYRNYVCKDCGGGFVTKHRLKTHAKNMHTLDNHACDECQKEFPSVQKLKNHINAVHKLVKRFKCPHCKERFVEYFQRQKHLVELHGATPLLYKCNVCDKSFDRRFPLSRHLKKFHLDERDFQCDACPYRCYTKNELKIHMIKHVGERIHECSVCKKAYARKRTLREHMRIHNNDRRFTCSVCGQAFIQKCSLKGHVKTHHPEINELH